MNVYDFDDTIYQGDCTRRFYFYCVLKHPFILRYLPLQIWGMVLYVLRLKTLTQAKEYFFSFLKGLSSVHIDIALFWDQEFSRIKPWYLSQKKSNDLIISASPFFLVDPACKRLGIATPIASMVDVYTGTYSGFNCKGEEKVTRFRNVFPDTTICAFYSDSLSDMPLALLSTNAFLVKGNTLLDWPFS